MRGFFGRHATTVVVAMVTSAVTAAAPSLAAAFDAVNTDKVDGRHAVAAGATIEERAGKLVATGSTGRLPNDIISKAPNADALDGLDAAEFLRKTGKAANADKLDGLDSADLWKKSDTLTAASADTAGTLDGWPPNSLTRVASVASGNTTEIAVDTLYGETLTIDAPAAGYVLVTSSVTVREDQDCTGPCWVAARIRHVQTSTESSASMDSGGTGWASLPNTAVFPVSAGVNTFQTRLTRESVGGGVLQGWWQNLSAFYSPFDATGAAKEG